MKKYIYFLYVSFVSFAASSQTIDTTLSIDVCFSYTTSNGIEHNISGTYYDTLVNSNGGDSIVQVSLYVHFQNGGISENGGTLTSVFGESYQWIECTTNTEIVGENSNTFTPSTNGDYAVIISDLGWVCQTECISIDHLSVEENLLAALSISPNPTSGMVELNFSQLASNTELEIFDSQGRVLRCSKMSPTVNMIDLSDEKDGMYFFHIRNNTSSRIMKVVKTSK